MYKVTDRKLILHTSRLLTVMRTISKTLLSLCERQEEEVKGEYKDLIEPLANEQVATLLQRAIRTGLLDEHYQPMPQTKPLQLKVIAYAVSTICKLPSAYILFEKQWKREYGKRFSTWRVPRYNTGLYKRPKPSTRKLTLLNLSQRIDRDILHTTE